MALASYSDLQSAIPSWLGRAGDTELTALTGDLITLAESRMYWGAEGNYPSPPLRLRAMEAQAAVILKTWGDGGTSGGSANAQTVTLSAVPTVARGLSFTFIAGFSNTAALTLNANSLGAVNVKKNADRSDLASGDVVAGAEYGVYHDGTQYVLTPGAGYAPMPTDWLEGRSARLIGDREYSLEQVISGTFSDEFDSATPSRPTGFSIEGDLFRFGPTSDDNYVAKLNYYKKLPALSTATNWIMTNKPDMYLFAALIEASTFVQDDANAQKYHGLYMSAATGLVMAEKRARFSGAPLKISVGGYVR